MSRLVLLTSLLAACAPISQETVSYEIDDVEQDRGVRAFGCDMPRFGAWDDHYLAWNNDHALPTVASGLENLVSLYSPSDGVERFEVDELVTVTLAFRGKYGSNEVWFSGMEGEGGIRGFDLDLSDRVNQVFELRVTEVTSYFGTLEITGITDVQRLDQARVPVLDMTREPMRNSHVGQIGENFGLVMEELSGGYCPDWEPCFLVSNEETSFLVRDTDNELTVGSCVQVIAPVVGSENEFPFFDGEADSNALQIYDRDVSLPVCDDWLDDGSRIGPLELEEGLTRGLRLGLNTDFYSVSVEPGETCEVTVRTMNRTAVRVTAGDLDHPLDMFEDRGEHLVLLEHSGLGATAESVDLLINRDGAGMCTRYQIEVDCM